MRRPGFTVLELATAVALLVLFVAIAVPTYKAFQGSGENSAARHRLAALEVELARVQAEAGGFPDDVHTRVPRGAEQVVDGATASTGPSSLSLHTIAEDTVAGAVLADSGHCLVAVFNVNDEPVWASDETPAPGACRAGHPAIVDEHGSWFGDGNHTIDMT